MDTIQRQLEHLSAQQREMGERIATLEAEALADDEREQAETASIRRTEVEVQALRDRMLEIEEPPREPARRDYPTLRRPDPQERYRVEIGDAHMKGPSNAEVTVVMWLDYQCPFCGRVQGTLSQVEKEYRKKVRFVFKHNPLPMHNRAEAAALAAEAAGRQGKFWQMSDLLWENQKELTDDRFLALAKKLRLDKRRFKADMKSPELLKKIKDQQAQAEKLGARGTPAFFINGAFLSGAQPLDAFKRVIDQALVEAAEHQKRGVSKAALYDELMKHARDGL